MQTRARAADTLEIAANMPGAVDAAEKVFTKMCDQARQSEAESDKDSDSKARG
jgi:hypothetical protein